MNTWKPFRVALVFLTLLVHSQSYIAVAQISDQVRALLPKPVPNSPNVTAFQKYGNHDVSFYNGLPEINIPLFEAKSGSLSAPITLRYHASGIKYTDQASWVGLGWSLNVGGQISRELRGKPDEQDFYSATLISSPSYCSNYDYIKKAATGVTDREPDLFSYSFPGKSGKFMLGQPVATDGRPYFLIPYEPILMDIDYASFAFDKFTIRDELGNAFVFGKNNAGQQVRETATSSNGGVTSGPASSTWYLTHMESPNSDDQISFTYQDIGLSSIEDVSSQITIIDQCDNTTNGQNYIPCSVFNNTANTIFSSTTVGQLGNDEIVFETGKVKFVASSQVRLDQLSPGSLRALDRIEIYAKVNGSYFLRRTIQFVFSYFKNSANTLNLRLKLDGIRVLNASGQTIEKYDFVYYTNSFSWDTPTNSFRRDLQGYFNNKPNSNLIPVTSNVSYQSTIAATPTTITIGGANRSTDTTFLKEGVLKRITYPTGGYSDFVFEPHQYLEGSAVMYPGGLRIRRIANSDGNTISYRTFKYGQNESGNGTKNFLAQRAFFTNEQLNFSLNIPPSLGSKKERVRMFFSAPTIALNAEEGSPVVYQQVSEYTGLLGDNAGKILYEYDWNSYMADELIIIPVVNRSYRNSNGWRRGKLTMVRKFDKNGSIVSKTATWFTLSKEENKTVGLGATSFRNSLTSYYAYFNNCVNEYGQTVFLDDYKFADIKQRSGALRPQTITEESFEISTNRLVVKTINYQYTTNFLQQREVSQVQSDTRITTTTKYRYPFDYNYYAGETGVGLALQTMVNKNMVATPTEQYTTRYDAAQNASFVIGGQLSQYALNPANSSQIILADVYLFEADAPILESSFSPSSKVGTSFVFDSRYKPTIKINYDDRGNVVQTQEYDNLKGGYLWGYDKTRVIADAVNAGASGAVEIFVQNFEESLGSGVDYPHTGLRYYQGDYLCLFTPPNSRSYLVDYWYWDGAKWVFTSKPYSGATVLSEGTAIDDVRVYPTDAQIKSYTHDPIWGITSVIDANGRTQYYDYDSFGRLVTIRNDKGGIEKRFTYQYKQF